MTAAPLFRFVQLDLPGRLGVADGRYLARTDEGDGVLVVETIGTPGPRRSPLRRPKASPASGDPPEVPLTRITAVEPAQLTEEAEARAWLATVKGDRDTAEAHVAVGAVLMNRALDAYRAAARDPHVPDAIPDRALAVRIGWGTGEQLADSNWSEAIELPPDRRRGRLDDVGSQERIAAVLRGDDEASPAELLLLRARADLAAGRLREAALELSAAGEAAKGARDAPEADAIRERIRALDRELRSRSGQGG